MLPLKNDHAVHCVCISIKLNSMDEDGEITDSKRNNTKKHKQATRLHTEQIRRLNFPL